MNVTRKITRKFENAGIFTIDEHRYNAIIDKSEYDAEWVDSALFYDWDNADEHQEWLNSAPISEIVDWVDSTVDSWK